jgi:glucokinase
MIGLVCDLGGTNCRVGSVNDGALLLDTVRNYQNSEFGSFLELLQHHVCTSGARRPDTVVIAMAAPIQGNRATLTNRNWTIDTSEISSVFDGARVSLINDLEALGHTLGQIGQVRTKSLFASHKNAKGPRLVVGVGTGFNCAVWMKAGVVATCEAGHATFTVETDLDRSVQADFTQRFGRCSTDRVLSGSGLLAIYEVICKMNHKTATLSDPKSVVDAAISGADQFAHMACDEFLRILGREVGDLALTFLPKGGIFLAGGVANALLSVLSHRETSFYPAFVSKGRMTDLLGEFSISVLEDSFASLHGCAVLQNQPLAS